MSILTWPFTATAHWQTTKSQVKMLSGMKRLKPWQPVFGQVSFAERRYVSTRFPLTESESMKKPKISEFKYPLYHTFVIAAGTFLLLDLLWTSFEYNIKEKEYEQRTRELEVQIKDFLNEKSNNNIKNKIQNILKFWK